VKIRAFEVKDGNVIKLARGGSWSIPSMKSCRRWEHLQKEKN
jgi:hypothetical protein